MVSILLPWTLRIRKPITWGVGSTWQPLLPLHSFKCGIQLLWPQYLQWPLCVSCLEIGLSWHADLRLRPCVFVGSLSASIAILCLMVSLYVLEKWSYGPREEGAGFFPLSSCIPGVWVFFTPWELYADNGGNWPLVPTCSRSCLFIFLWIHLAVFVKMRLSHY